MAKSVEFSISPQGNYLGRLGENPGFVRMERVKMNMSANDVGRENSLSDRNDKPVFKAPNCEPKG
jgi:hypothetical protein